MIIQNKRIRIYKQTSFIIIGLVFFLFSCNNKIAISDSDEIDNNIWAIDTIVKSEVNIEDISKFYNVFINVNVKEDFLTNNLWLFINTKSPIGNVQSDTLLFYITNEKGKWFGNKSGSVISNKFLYKSNIKFPKAGEYTFLISHGMREKDLPKVTEVGVTIEEVL